MLDRSRWADHSFLAGQSWLENAAAFSACSLSRLHSAGTDPWLVGGFATKSQGVGCELLGPVGLAAQFAITVVCAVAFLASWFFETPRRDFLTWLLDVGKQVVGAAYGKVYNITQSIVFAKLLRQSHEHDDQCVWYLMTLAADCFILTFLLWGASNFMRPILLSRYGVDIGEYEGPRDAHAAPGDVEWTRLKVTTPREVEACLTGAMKTWLVQLAVWLAIITVVRLFLSTCLFFVQHQLYVFCAQIFVHLGLESETSRLLFAVLIFPAVADTFQIVVQDYFLKKRR